ncbi:MAG: S8 family serine peptidase [Bryobacterales bacterium]|nr:S8 family serine peptidase [Bryobacterales bacterium]
MSGAPTTRGFQLFSINIGDFPFIQISFDDPAAALFVSAYTNSFSPVNSAPNYGLDVNYLGDPGLSQPFGNPSFFQIKVTPNSTILIPINEIGPGGGSGATFNLLVEGFYDTDYNDIPEPGPYFLVAFGLGLIWLVRRPPVARKWLAGGAGVFALLMPVTPANAQTDVGPLALQQMRELLQEKASRTASQRKLASRLVYAVKSSRGIALGANIPSLAGDVNSIGGDALVDMKAAVSSDLLSAIQASGGTIIYSSAGAQRIRARLPLSRIEGFADRGDVRSIRPASRARTHGMGTPRRPMPASFFPLSALRGFAARPDIVSLTARLGLGLFVGSLSTQGDITHAANLARRNFGINGSGVRVGVLSDSAEAVPFLIGTGDLPPGTTIVQDIISGPGSSEGSAMMEIVHDMVPGAQLFFASAFNSEASFADNIRTLRNVYQCDVIVDDVSYSGEFAFQDGLIAQAVNDVRASGALYFSSAGNSGNLTSGNSSAWEGDFSNGGVNPLLPGYTLHSFGAQSFNRLLTTTNVLDLYWSDPIGGSGNDYDLFVLNASGTAVLAASTDLQTGADDPIEEVAPQNGIPGNSRVVIVAFGGAAPRALHVGAFYGEPLQIQTNGVTHGHGGGASTVSVAAVFWNSGRAGTRPFTGGSRNPTEIFSSDGPRRIFFNPGGTAITPGNLLFGSNGGLTLVKPDIAAADGVTTRTPDFNPFFGTSAAAPHAAAIAALIKSAKPSLTAAQIYNAMISTALDIRAPGIDRDAGFGLVMAPPAVAAGLQ